VRVVRGRARPLSVRFLEPRRRAEQQGSKEAEEISQDLFEERQSGARTRGVLCGRGSREKKEQKHVEEEGTGRRIVLVKPREDCTPPRALCGLVQCVCVLWCSRTPVHFAPVLGSSTSRFGGEREEGRGVSRMKASHALP
jgi:hypothetical protein